VYLSDRAGRDILVISEGRASVDAYENPGAVFLDIPFPVSSSCALISHENKPRADTPMIPVRALLRLPRHGFYTGACPVPSGF
jgi:hypothetical protein